MVSRRRGILIVAGILVIGFVLLQLIPAQSISSQFARTNPAAVSEIAWNSAETEQVVRTACYDCHSNETVWPWYAQIAPVSWLVAKDTNEGREALNFSEQTAAEINPDELIEEVEGGAMPPRSYLILHPAANLTDAQKEALFAGLRASLHGAENEGAASGEAGERGENGEAGEEQDND
jgi:mono/diheme cytochrome c family protein